MMAECVKVPREYSGNYFAEQLTGSYFWHGRLARFLNEWMRNEGHYDAGETHRLIGENAGRT